MLKFMIYFLLVIAVLFPLLYFMPIKIKFKTLRKNADDVIVIRIKTLYGLIDLKFEVPFLDIVFIGSKPALRYKAEVESNKTNKLWTKISKIFTAEDLISIQKYFRHDPVLLQRLKAYWLKVLVIRKFSLIIKFGFSDAALAALLYGALWTVLGSILSIMSNHMNFETQDIVITPSFDKDLFNMEFSCIIKFKFGNIINTGIMVLRRRSQIKKLDAVHKNTINAS